jgi:antitoxin MazE
MKVELVRIGNSRGLRIPKALIEQCGFGNTVELRVEKDCLVIAPDRAPRQGWEKAFKAVTATSENELLLDTVAPNEFDQNEWQW